MSINKKPKLAIQSGSHAKPKKGKKLVPGRRTLFGSGFYGGAKTGIKTLRKIGRDIFYVKKPKGTSGKLKRTEPPKRPRLLASIRYNPDLNKSFGELPAKYENKARKFLAEFHTNRFGVTTGQPLSTNPGPMKTIPQIPGEGSMLEMRKKMGTGDFIDPYYAMQSEAQVMKTEVPSMLRTYYSLLSSLRREGAL